MWNLDFLPILIIVFVIIRFCRDNPIHFADPIVHKFKYTRTQLYSMSCVKPDPYILNCIANVGLLRYRGNRAGVGVQARRYSFKINKTVDRVRSTFSPAQANPNIFRIETVSGRRPPGRKCKHQKRSTHNIIQIPRLPMPNKMKPVFLSSAPHLDSPPSLYVFNAAALTKPHAIEQLRADIGSCNVDVVIITETKFNSKHADSSFAIENYTMFRHDRMNNRPHGGVAIYTRSVATTWNVSMGQSSI